MTWCPIKLSKSDFLKGFSSLKKSSDWLDVWPFWFTLKQWILWIFFQFLAQTLAQTLALTYDRFQKNNYKKPSAVLRFMGLVKRLNSVNSQHAEELNRIIRRYSHSLNMCSPVLSFNLLRRILSSINQEKTHKSVPKGRDNTIWLINWVLMSVISSWFRSKRAGNTSSKNNEKPAKLQKIALFSIFTSTLNNLSNKKSIKRIFIQSKLKLNQPGLWPIRELDFLVFLAVWPLLKIFVWLII